jgi:spore maturation protein CgeB
LKNKDELIEMGRSAREHVLKYHSPEARARTIINALTQ